MPEWRMPGRHGSHRPRHGGLVDVVAALPHDFAQRASARRAKSRCGCDPVQIDGDLISGQRPCVSGCARPAVDPGPGHGPGRPPVRGLLHAARHVVPAAPPRLLAPGPGPPGRRARRGRGRRVAGGDLGQSTRLAALAGAWICFEDEAGQSLRPGKARTWAPRGRTPVTRVSASGPVAVATKASR